MKVNLKHIKILNIKPGDDLAITLESDATQEDAEKVKYILEKAYPGRRILIMGGIVKEIHVVRGLND